MDGKHNAATNSQPQQSQQDKIVLGLT